MKRIICLILWALASTLGANAQIATVLWDMNYGGWEMDNCRSMCMSSDSGFFMAGYTTSTDSFDVSGFHGQYDGWVIKTDKNGTLLWQRCLGGSLSEALYDVYATTDSGCIVTGYTKSVDGDLALVPMHGSEDIWVVKLNASGNIQWQKCIGGSLADEGRTIIVAQGGGYLLAGNGVSNDGDISGHHGNTDIFLVKLDDTGAIQWQRCLGGTNSEIPAQLKQTSDGGYILAAYSGSNDGDVNSNQGDYDFWVVKLNDTGGISWQKSFGGSALDEALDAIECPDGGFLAVGMTASSNGDITYSHGNYDAWVIKMSVNGTMEWQRTYGGFEHEGLTSVTVDGSSGYYMAGNSRSDNGDVIPGTHGNPDYWFVHINSTGSLISQACLGGVDPDGGVGFAQTADGGFVLGGTAGWASYDVSNNNGAGDFWLVKMLEPVGVQDIYKETAGISISNIPGGATYVALPVELTQAVLVVYNMSGQLVPAEISGSGMKRTVKLNNLAAGMYILAIMKGNEVYHYSISR